MMLRLLGAWIIDVRTGRGLSPIKQESNRRGWMGRRTGWNRTHVVPLSLTLRCYNYQIKVSVRASIFLCRVVHMEQLEVHQTKQKTSKAYKLLTHHFLLNHSWMHRCFLTWKHLHLWSNMWPQHQQCTVWVEAHCSTFEASQSFFFFFSSSKLSLPEPGRSSVTCPGLPTDIPGDKALSGTPQILLQCCYGPGLETLNQSSQAGSNHGVSKAADYDND